jgi:hypothetical protein
MPQPTVQAIIYATPTSSFHQPALFVRSFLIDIPLSRDLLQLKYLGDN